MQFHEHSFVISLIKTKYQPETSRILMKYLLVWISNNMNDPRASHQKENEMEQDINSDFLNLLQRATRGESNAVSDLFDQVSKELRVIARSRLRGVSRGSSLQTTVLIDDVFMHLLRGVPVDIQERTAYLRIAGHAMRDVVVNSIRAECAQKRGGGRTVSRAVENTAVDSDHSELVMISEIIDNLSTQHPRTAQVIILHCIGGHTRKQVASMLEISVPTIDRELALGRAWIGRDMASTNTTKAQDGSSSPWCKTQRI